LDHPPSLNLWRRQAQLLFPYISKFNKLGNVGIKNRRFFSHYFNIAKSLKLKKSIFMLRIKCVLFLIDIFIIFSPLNVRPVTLWIRGVDARRTLKLPRFNQIWM